MHRYTVLDVLILALFLVVICYIPAACAEPLSGSPIVLKSASELDYPPFAIVQQDGTADGFSVDLLKAATQAVGLSVTFKTGPWYELKQELADKILDVLPLVSFSEERDKVYDFTTPYLQLNGTIFIRKGNAEIQTLTDLKNKEVLVMQGDTAHEYALREKLSNNIIAKVSYEEAFKLLASGKHDAIIVQQIVGLQLIKKLNITNVVPVEQKHISSLKPMALKLEGFEQKFCFAVPEGNKQLLAQLNEGLAVISLNGTYNSLYEKWFAPILPAPQVPFSQLVKQVISILIPLLLLVTFFGLWYLKRLVAQRTKHLGLEIQQRKEVEKELLQSHDLLANLARLVPGVIYQYRLYPDGRSAFPYSSPGMNNIYEVTPEEVQDDATPVFGRLHPDDFDKVSNSIQESAQTLRTFVCEFRVNLPKQGLRWRWSEAQPERMPDGGTLWHGIISDITELKQAEQKLQESEKRFQQMFMNAPMPYQSLDEQGNFLDVNQAFLDILGYSRGEVIGKNFGDILHPDWVSHFKNNFPRFRAIGEILGVEFEMVKKDGSTILVYFNGKVQLDEQGRFQRTHCIFQDITERRRIEEALIQSEKDLKKSQRIALVGSWRLDTTTNQVEWTEELYRMYGFDPTLPPPPFTEHRQLFTPESWERLSSSLSATSTTGIPYELELETVRNDGSNGWMWVRGEAVNDAAGNIIGLWGAAQDITDRKAFEAEREKLQAQLTQAQKMESVGRLAGGVAHDFNNMLAVILGHTEMALDDVDPAAPLHASLEAIQYAAERSATLTRQLLAFARKQTVAPKVVDINEAVAGMLNMLRRLIGEDIDLLWCPAENLPPIKVDPAQIDQLLANLCVNARDAIEGVGKITIETDRKIFDEAYCADHLGFLPGEYVLIEVSDDGCGMDQTILNQIFEPFFTTKEQGKGTGLGLASVFGMVKQNNGFINVYSEPGQGTTFKIYLPAFASKSAWVMEKEQELPTEHGHETILLVEDEPAILQMTTMMLTRLGYTVVAAATPGEAIRLALEYRERIDLLMTDVVMPEMNGRELAGNLLSHYPDLKRLFMSGYTANVIAHHGVLDEGVNFIQKPFSMKDLGKKLREALED